MNSTVNSTNNINSTDHIVYVIEGGNYYYLSKFMYYCIKDFKQSADFTGKYLTCPVCHQPRVKCAVRYVWKDGQLWQVIRGTRNGDLTITKALKDAITTNLPTTTSTPEPGIYYNGVRKIENVSECPGFEIDVKTNDLNIYKDDCMKIARKPLEPIAITPSEIQAQQIVQTTSRPMNQTRRRTGKNNYAYSYDQINEPIIHEGDARTRRRAQQNQPKKQKSQPPAPKVQRPTVKVAPKVQPAPVQPPEPIAVPPPTDDPVENAYVKDPEPEEELDYTEEDLMRGAVMITELHRVATFNPDSAQILLYFWKELAERGPLDEMEKELNKRLNTAVHHVPLLWSFAPDGYLEALIRYVYNLCCPLDRYGLVPFLAQLECAYLYMCKVQQILNQSDQAYVERIGRSLPTETYHIVNANFRYFDRAITFLDKYADYYLRDLTIDLIDGFIEAFGDNVF